MEVNAFHSSSDRSIFETDAVRCCCYFNLPINGVHLQPLQHLSLFVCSLSIFLRQYTLSIRIELVDLNRNSYYECCRDKQTTLVLLKYRNISCLTEQTLSDKLTFVPLAQCQCVRACWCECMGVFYHVDFELIGMRSHRDANGCNSHLNFVFSLEMKLMQINHRSASNWCRWKIFDAIKWNTKWNFMVATNSIRRKFSKKKTASNETNEEGNLCVEWQ